MRFELSSGSKIHILYNVLYCKLKIGTVEDLNLTILLKYIAAVQYSVSYMCTI